MRDIPASDRTLARMLELRAGSDPERPFVEIDGETLTLRALATAAARRAEGLDEAGVVAGDRVAIMAGNRRELVELFFACAWNGSILTPINVASRGLQLEHLLANLAPKAVVGEEALLAALHDVEVPASVEHVWSLTTLPEAERERGRFATRPADTLTILYTSGTTGPAKGVCCPNAQFYWWGLNTARALRVSADDVLHTTLPLFHTNALNTLVQALVTGARCVVGPRFSASRFWPELHRSGATRTYILGAMASILVGREPGPHDSGHAVRLALAPGTPTAVVEEFERRFGVELVEGHGMTETNFAIGPRDGVQRAGTMGRAMPGFDARVVDEHDADVPDGTPGELVLRTSEPLAFASGYHMQPEVTAQAWRDGWFRTGDRAMRDADGFFRFVDRLKDAIRRRGENISAWEVEQVVASHPDVAAVAVIGVPSDLGEDDVMAFVVPRGAGFDPAQIAPWCKPRLAYFAIPRYVEVVESLPLTQNGKIEKGSLRARGVTPTTWDRDRAPDDVGATN